MNEENMKKLVELSKKKDTDAFAKLYELVYKDMYAYACYMLDNKQDAEDVVSDTVVTAFEGIKKLREAALFRQWIFKILSNKCKKRRMQYAKQPVQTLTDQYGEEVLEETSTVDRLEIQRVFSLLSNEERLIVNSFIFGGFKGEEIAENLGIKHSTLRSKYRRSLIKMQKALESGGVII